MASFAQRAQVSRSEPKASEDHQVGERRPSDRRRSGGYAGLTALAGIAVAVLLAAVLVGFALHSWLFPSPFEPVRLSAPEQRVLDAKVRRIGFEPAAREPSAPRADPAPFEPEPYREDPAAREIAITERELNALLAHNTNLADRLAIDLSANLASAKLLIPIDPEVPFIGGRIVRVNAGIELAYVDRRPRVMLRGISLMGAPLPNAWLGGLKNVDLVEQFGAEPGFWRTFAAGIESLEIRDGELELRLAE